MERDPVAVYDKLFSAFMPSDDPTARSRSRALDAVVADANRLKKRVSVKDGQRLDAHLESVFQLKKQMFAIPPECAVPEYPDVPLYNSDNTEPMERTILAFASHPGLRYRASMRSGATACSARSKPLAP